ncbi:Hypothetical protein R9X50_00309600 [Acrodontium crateriforme]|uniref:Uncharacterized protein n=1 Tax=Acrodontium crateriforme TaxID=150365 RepID=A0AAQ3M8E9_9PEZI|nr:Hypothetical protein R9X50_00309600 [Acrodontium crateriforme]
MACAGSMKRICILFAIYILATFGIGNVHAQGTQTYYFSGAVEVWPASTPTPGTAAVPAVCPADHPLSCSSIGASDYCCPAGNYCAWSNSQVACCPNGQTCSGYIGGGGGYEPTTWYQTTWQQPTTTYYYQTPTTTVIVAGGGSVTQAGIVTLYTTAQTTKEYNGYCSTEFATGPGLPTTAAGECGTILIVEPSEGTKQARIGILLIGLHIMGNLLFFWR